MYSIMVNAKSIDRIIKKEEVIIVYLNSGKYYVCKNEYTNENGMFTFELAPKQGGVR